jgi:O-methyltransferase domain
MEDCMTSAAAPWKTGGDAYQQMAGTIFDYWSCWTISAMADLSIADHLADGSLTADEVALREGSGSEATLRLMRAGVAVGLLTEEVDGRFGSTPLLATLRTDDPKSVRPWVQSMMGSYWPWAQFSNALREGNTPSTNAYDGTIFDYLAGHPEEAALFSAAMASITGVWGSAFADAIDTSGVKCAVDVGGANGSLLRHLQRKNPSLQGIIFDRPNTIQHAEAAIREAGLTQRTRVVGGNFFESVPSGDLLLLKFILHDWADADSTTILQRCREALAPEGRIAVVEMVVDKANPYAGLMDMMMFTACTGRERSIEEYDALFEAAGLKRTAVRDTGTPMGVIEAGLA